MPERQPITWEKDVTIYQSIDASVESKFVGYDRLTHESKVTVLTTQDAIVDELKEGEEGTILVEETPDVCNDGWSGSRCRCD